MGEFTRHLQDAIAVNRDRKPYYARQTGGTTRGLSNALIAAEALLLPGAWVVDRWARRYNRRGIPIVADDFVSMTRIPPKDRVPARQGRVPARQQDEVTASLRSLRTRLVAGDVRDDLPAICACADAFLDRIDRWEAVADVHWAMTKHLVESLGYAALHGIDYARDTGGQTRGLTRCLVAGHALLLPTAASLDVRAQAAHRRGAGIIVNDVPLIPFREETRK